jgi:gamma-glutamylcyclotransferase (GGCT)/AIG2-like uncharacterized protein YtfP
MSEHLVFVYGTLRREGGRAMSERFPGARFVAEAEVGGSLYDLGAFPGVWLDSPGTTVVGEAYEVGDETLNELDAFEAADNYRRRRAEITLAGGGSRAGWIYEPDPEVYYPRTLIASGDWVEYANTKTDRPEAARPEETRS